MANRIGKYTIKCENNPSIISHAVIGGQNEGNGPLGNNFDIISYDDKLGQKTWEDAESQMQNQAVQRAIAKGKLYPKDIDYIFAGDLLNQCTGATFGLSTLNIPFLGQFGACSTMAQTIAMATFAVEGGIANRCVSVTSSHFCTAERQFRYPLDYGSVKAPTSQWTATASGAVVIGKGGKVKVEHITVGKINDLGIKDCNNMGAAMAPAGADTIINFFKDTNTTPNDYDRIYTGDLGKVGSDLLYTLAQKEGYTLQGNHDDCGLLLYDTTNPKICSGGSGCGCSASVLCSKILPDLENEKMKNVLFIATGALLSQTSTQQKKTIPAIAHLVHFKVD